MAQVDRVALDPFNECVTPEHWIILSEELIGYADTTGVRRDRPYLRDRHGFEGNGRWIHLLGARGEVAFCYWAGFPFPANVNTFRRCCDVLNFEVKTRSRHDYDLLIRRDDIPVRKAVLVTTTNNPADRRYCIRGWYSIGAAQQHEEWLRDYGGRERSFFVPQDQLADFTYEQLSMF